MGPMNILSVLILAVLAPQEREIQTRTIEYKQGDAVLEGYLASPKDAAGKLPGVLVFHEWKGHGSYVRQRADQLARLGYAAFAADIYGKGVTAKDHVEAGKLAGMYKSDRALLRARAKAAFDVLAANADPERIAAMGYCFGGTCALELARSGAPLKAAASFHGDLSTPTPADAKNIRGRVIVFNGADDPYVKEDSVLAFQKEMREGGVDWQFVSFGGAVHSFTVKEAGGDPSKGAAYNEKADLRSLEILQGFLAGALR